VGNPKASIRRVNANKLKGTQLVRGERIEGWCEARKGMKKDATGKERRVNTSMNRTEQEKKPRQVTGSNIWLDKFERIAEEMPDNGQ